MVRHVLVLIALAGCEDKRAREAQERFDRQVERTGGIERDKDGRAYRVATGEYLDSRGGTVANSERVEGQVIRSTSQLPPEPPETDVARGELAAFQGDYAEAARLFEKACSEKVAGGCAALALMHRDGSGGVKKDPQLAEQMLRALCEANDGVGCYGLGIVYETGSTRHSAEEVIALYDKGCTLGSVDACNALAMVYHSGRGGAPQDKDKAAAALRRGCDLGDRMSCLQIDMVKR